MFRQRLRCLDKGVNAPGSAFVIVNTERVFDRALFREVAPAILLNQGVSKTQPSCCSWLYYHVVVPVIDACKRPTFYIFPYERCILDQHMIKYGFSVLISFVLMPNSFLSKLWQIWTKTILVDLFRIVSIHNSLACEIH